MNAKERNNQPFQQHHYGGIVQGFPVVDNPSAPPMSASSNYAPPSNPLPTAAPVPSTGASQNHAPAPPPSSMPGDRSSTPNSNSVTATGSSTVVSNSTTVVVTGPPIIEVIDDSLPCGCGTGWFMFIIGWFFAIPWYVGACILICGKIDPRERPGHIACAVMAGIFTVALIATSTHHATNGN